MHLDITTDAMRRRTVSIAIDTPSTSPAPSNLGFHSSYANFSDGSVSSDLFTACITSSIVPLFSRKAPCGAKKMPQPTVANLAPWWI